MRFAGVGMGHLGSKGRAMVSAALELSLRKMILDFMLYCIGCFALITVLFCVFTPAANYPEYLDKCVMLNTPWIFNTFWYFIKGFLDEM